MMSQASDSESETLSSMTRSQRSDGDGRRRRRRREPASRLESYESHVSRATSDVTDTVTVVTREDHGEPWSDSVESKFDSNAKPRRKRPPRSAPKRGSVHGRVPWRRRPTPRASQVASARGSRAWRSQTRSRLAHDAPRGAGRAPPQEPQQPLESLERLAPRSPRLASPRLASFAVALERGSILARPRVDSSLNSSLDSLDDEILVPRPSIDHRTIPTTRPTPHGPPLRSPRDSLSKVNNDQGWTSTPRPPPRTLARSP